MTPQEEPTVSWYPLAGTGKAHGLYRGDVQLGYVQEVAGGVWLAWSSAIEPIEGRNYKLGKYTDKVAAMDAVMARAVQAYLEGQDA